MRKLLKRTVKMAVNLDLVELAVQAVDGSKVWANASGGKTLDAAGLRRLLERVDKAIEDLEAQNEESGEARGAARAKRKRRLHVGEAAHLDP